MIEHAPDSIGQRVGSAFDEGQQRRPRVVPSARNIGRDDRHSNRERLAHDEREPFAFGWQKEETRSCEQPGHVFRVSDEVHPLRKAEILGERARSVLAGSSSPAWTNRISFLSNLANALNPRSWRLYGAQFPTIARGRLVRPSDRGLAAAEHAEMSTQFQIRSQ